MDHPNFQSIFSDAATSSSGFDPMFSGISLQTLLSLNPSLFPDYPTLSSLTDNPPPPLNLPEPTDTPNLGLLVPKTEHPHLPQLTPQPHHPFDFFTNYQPYDPYSSSSFHRLPQLRSAERHPPEQSFTHHKRLRIEDSPKTTTYSSSPAPAALVRGKAASVIPQSNLARQRRQKLSEKTRCLQKLMPWDKKMDQATLLEEAYKYVRFLQAQLRALRSMPSSDTTSSSLLVSHNVMHKNSGSGGGVFGDLERLNRNQVLQVLVNSPVAQTMLCSQGFCVFSVEQLALLRKFSERRLLLQQMISDHASSKAFFN